jgi:hypothetical protein
VDSLLCRKEVRQLLQWERTTLWRREREGLRFVADRISLGNLMWWLEQRDAAIRLGMRVQDFLEMPREAREKLLAAALAVKEARAGAESRKEKG